MNTEATTRKPKRRRPAGMALAPALRLPLRLRSERGSGPALRRGVGRDVPDGWSKGVRHRAQNLFCLLFHVPQ